MEQIRPKPKKAKAGPDCVPLTGRHRHEGVLGLYRDAFKDKEGDVGADIGAEAFKNALIQWSSSYYIAYALILTIGIGMLLQAPFPREYPEWDSLTEAETIAEYFHWRPHSLIFDAFVSFLYTVFALWLVYDTTWGVMLAAEWGVRVPAMPAKLFERFTGRVTTFDNKSAVWQNLRNDRNTWGFHCCDFRAAWHADVRLWGLGWGMTSNCKSNVFNDCGNGGICCVPISCGVYGYPAWDGFYFLERVVQMMFLASTCYLYLTQGLLYALVCVIFHILLAIRVSRHLFVPLYALIDTMLEEEGTKEGAGQADATGKEEARNAAGDEDLEVEEADENV